MRSYSPLQNLRLKYQPILPELLERMNCLQLIPQANLETPLSIQEIFPETTGQPVVFFEPKNVQNFVSLNIGVVLSGGQAPGGHNVIAGLFDALKKMHSNSTLIGFSNGPSGILNNEWIEITEDLLDCYRNQGGFDIIGSGRTKIETPEQFTAAAATVKSLKLNGLVIIGGDDSNTNAAFLAEHFKRQGTEVTIIGVPKTIDGDLKNKFIETSFGFDTASKIYSEIIGNVQKDAISSKKYYHFIKLMGRSASNITLECALKTRPNLALIGEEIAEKKLSLKEVVALITDMVCQRAAAGRDYGVILIPEGLIEFISDIKEMIQDLNHLLPPSQPHAKKMDALATHDERLNYLATYLTKSSMSSLLELPEGIQKQLLLERDSHGNVQVSKIETERLLIDLVEKELLLLKQQGRYKGKFNPQPHFCGYEGRSALPSNFDCNYCYALGYAAALLLQNGKTGYMACIKDLHTPVKEWKIVGIPITGMLNQDMREGKRKIVIKRALVDLKGVPFRKFCEMRTTIDVKEDDYLSPGPIQFEGPGEICNAITLTLYYESI
ncbi:MAG: diphosphate--fructose-6-phosphate 1-phosphotransferase [Candidatus Protochlamydia sp.]|nr:diphosphate--fructose-6-phosphate 1-phosphotransferase [Candidatus Protochlamydia sp.]